MDIYLITFSLEQNKRDSVYKFHEVLLSEIEKYFTLHIINYDELDAIPEDGFKLIFIATGGVERLITNLFEKLPHPPILLTDGLQNSLAATLETSAWIRNKGMKFQIIHGDNPSVIKQILLSYNNHHAQLSIRGKRIGVIGTPSSWLVASNVDYLLAKRRWGIEFIDISLDRVYSLFEKVTNDQIGEQASLFAGKALACREATPDDLLSAMRLYKSIRQICEEEKLDALTLSCFKFLESFQTTGCLALSLLNDEGIIAGCEGDLQSVFTMLCIKTLTGQVSFMANPWLIMEQSNEILLSHCSISTQMTEQFIIRNHFETEKGIAIQGILPIGDVTLVKCGGECLDEFFLSSGTLVENTNYVNTCRTQIKVKLDNPVSYFLRNPLGNHHLLILGNHEKELNDFLQFNNCKRVE